MVLGYSNGTGNAQGSTFWSTCSLNTQEVIWGLNQYFVNVRNALFPSSNGTNSSIVTFNAEIIIPTSSISGSNVSINCNTGPAFAPVIRLLRKGLGQVLTMVYNTTSINYTVAPFDCSQQDEYICEVNSLQKTFVLNYAGPCPANVVEPKVNATYTCKFGGQVAIPPIIVFSSYTLSEFTLLFRENEVTYKARPDMYSVLYSSRSAYYSSIYLAVFDMKEGDSHEYFFTFRSYQHEVVVYFTISVEPNTDYKPAVTALSILFALLVISVTAVLGVYLFRRYRSKRSEPPASHVTLHTLAGSSESYDALGTAKDEPDMYYGTVAETPASSKQNGVGTYENTKIKMALKPKNFQAKSQNIYGNTAKHQTGANKAGNIPIGTQNTYKNVPKTK